MADLNPASAALLASVCAAHGLDVSQQSLHDVVTELKGDDIMHHDADMAIEAANAFDRVACAGAVHSIRAFFEKRDVPIVRRAQMLEGTN
jgi:hypothetical protein